MKQLILIPLAPFSLTSLPAAAEDRHMNIDRNAAAQNHRGSGTVNSVDAKSGKINLPLGPCT